MAEDTVNIRIKKGTWRALHNMKDPNDSFDDVIQRLLAESDEGNPRPAGVSS